MFSSSQTKTTWILSSRQVSTVHAHCLHACACMHMHTHTGATPPPTKRATHTNSDHIQYTAGVSLSDPHKSIKQMEGWMPSIRWLITLQKDKLQRPSKILCHALLYKNPIFKGNSLLLRERGQEREYQLFFDFKVDKIRENSKSIAEQGGGVRLTVKLYVLMYTGSCKTSGIFESKMEVFSRVWNSKNRGQSLMGIFWHWNCIIFMTTTTVTLVN